MVFEPRQTMLLFIRPGEAEALLDNHRPAAIPVSSWREAAIIERCNRGVGSRAIAAKGMLSGPKGAAIRLVIAGLSQLVRREIEEYSVLFSHRASIDYYSASAAHGTGLVQSEYSCFRFAQADVGPSGNIEVAFDLVAALDVAESNDAVLLTPLRLYVAQPSGKSRSRTVGVAVGIQADAVWREEYRGRKERVWDERILAEGLDLNDGPVAKYYLDVAGAERRLPLPPVSFGVVTSGPYGRIEVTVSAGEVGELPTSLEALGALLSARDPLTPLLFQAAPKPREVFSQ